MNDRSNEGTKMKLEVGKTYRLNNGDVRECKRMVNEDPLSVDSYGFGPFVICGMFYHMDGTHGNGKSESLNVASCVEDTPTLWRDMTPEEKGALLLAHHEGDVIEYTKVNMDGEWREDQPEWRSYCAYRIRPSSDSYAILEPKVETVTLYWDVSWDIASAYSDGATHSITFNTIDGKPNTASIKMEKLEDE